MHKRFRKRKLQNQNGKTDVFCILGSSSETSELTLQDP